MNDQPIDKEFFANSGYQYASTGQRLANFLIDNILIYLLNTLLLQLYGLHIFQWLITTPLTQYEDLSLLQITVNLIGILHICITLLLFFTISEYFTRGKTIGKIITGTRAVRDDYTSISFKDALLRSLCRIIPFEPFSFLGGSNGWHDTMTGTTVIRDK